MEKRVDANTEKIVIISTIENGKQLIEEVVGKKKVFLDSPKINEGDVNDKIEIIETNRYNLSHCIGCNHCWIKTPGKCCIHDGYEEINHALYNH